MRTARIVVARKMHHCWDCERLIRPGERHLLSSLTPGHESGHPDHWTHGRFCQRCCETYGFERQMWQEALAVAS